MSFNSNIASSIATPATSFAQSFSEKPQELATTPLTRASFSEPLNFDEPVSEPDRFNLKRYIDAQDRNGIFERVLQAIRDGGKIPRPTIAWMWFVFPQMDHCKTRRRPSRIVRSNRDVWPRGQALINLDEARAILKHPILGPRMQRMANALLNTRHADIFCAMDYQLLDVQRVHSTMTIFREASRRPLCMHEIIERGRTNVEFRLVLDKHFAHATDSDDEMTWGEPLRPPHKRSARHLPTIRELEIRDVDVVEKRLASKNIFCVCANKSEELDRIDEDFMKKVREKRKKRIQKGINNRGEPPSQRKIKEIDEAPEGWVTVEPRVPTFEETRRRVSDLYRGQA